MSMFKKEGEQLIVCETGERARLFIVENFGFSHYPKSKEMLKFINAIADSGGNGVRVFGFYPMGKGREEEPYRKIDDRFDLSQLNETYVTYLRKWMNLAKSRGVVVLYELFDSVGLKFSSIAEYHPLGQFTGGQLDDFSRPDPTLLQHQKNYLTHIVNILKEYPNVIFAIMNEFDGDKDWHHDMSRHVKDLASDHLIAGSAETSTARDDPTVDIWISHSASYDRVGCHSKLAHDIATMRPHIGGKIVGYSTDGFQRVGMHCENPEAMRELAQDMRDQGLQIFGFLDHFAYIGLDDAGNKYELGAWLDNTQVYETSWVSRANIRTYRAIAEVYQPVPAPLSIPGVVGKFHVVALDHLQTSIPLIQINDIIENDHDKGERKTVSSLAGGVLSYGPYVTGYPTKPLEVYFGIAIDTNKGDDLPILALDVHDFSQMKILAQDVITRSRFLDEGQFSLFKLAFTPTEQSKLEFKIYYYGYAQATVKADKIAVVEPDQLQIPINTHDDLVALFEEAFDLKIIVRESLKDGKSEKGSVNDGDFTPEGLQLRGGDECFISYNIPTTPGGFIEFKARGFVQDELHGGPEYKGVLVTMWDGIAGYDYEHASFIFEFRKYGFIPGEHPLNNAVWFKIKAGGVDEDAWADKIEPGLSWDPNTTYRFRVEWDGRENRAFRDDQLVATITSKADFAPPDHRIQIGAQPLRGRKTAHNLLISDVVIGKL